MDRTTKINELVSSIYPSKKYGELDALSRLFSKIFLLGLEQILNYGCRDEECFKEKYNVSVGWIDKIPLASFIYKEKDIHDNLIKGKVEIGDLLLVYTHSQTFEDKGKRVIQSLDMRAVIIQAKISKTKFPTVPITKLYKSRVTSTSKELKLLSEWPLFDLYKNSRSKSKELENINLSRDKACAMFSGFYDKKWYCGEPDLGNICKLSLGELFTNLINGSFGSKFNPDTKNLNDWDRLIDKLLKLCGNYQLPGYIFGKNKSRLQTTGTLSCNPIGLSLDFFVKKKFPVLVINRIFFEGKMRNIK